MFTPHHHKAIKIASIVALASGITLSPMLTNVADASVKYTAYDTQAEVNTWYKTRFLPAMNQTVEWSGSSTKCLPGNISSKNVTSISNQINALRDIMGLDRVTVKADATMQRTALMMDAQNSLSHSPGKSWKCYTSAGAKGAGMSNLAYSYPSAKVGTGVHLYITEPGAGNIVVGHRRWLFKPQTTQFNLGQTKEAQSLQVFNIPTNSKSSNPAWVNYPRAGYFPTQVTSDRWSTTSGNQYLKWVKPTVTVKKNGVKLSGIKVHTPAYGYGNPTLVWDMPAGTSTKPGTYQVTITGATYPGKTPVSVSYTTKLFTAK